MLSLHLKIPPLPESPPSPPGWETPGKGERGRAPLRPWGGGGVGYYIKASTGHPHWESQPLVTPGRDGDRGCVAHPARPGTPAGEWSGPHCHSGTGGRGGGVGGGLRPPEFPPSWEESEVGGGDFVAPPRHLYCRGGHIQTWRSKAHGGIESQGLSCPKTHPWRWGGGTRRHKGACGVVPPRSYQLHKRQSWGHGGHPKTTGTHTWGWPPAGLPVPPLGKGCGDQVPPKGSGKQQLLNSPPAPGDAEGKRT